MAHDRLQIGLGLVSCIVAAFAAAVAFDAPQRPARAIASPPPQAVSAPRALPFSPPVSAPPSTAHSTSDANDEIEYAKDRVEAAEDELDEEAALESALLTLIRARGRGTDARR